MKIVTYILVILLLVTLGGGAYFYLYKHEPMAVEYAKLQAGQPEFDKARKEINQLKAKEKQESGWCAAVVDALKKGLGSEIAAGKAEVISSGNRVIVNIAEDVLYTPMSITFARTGQQNLLNLATLLKELKDKEIFVGNMTKSVPAQGKGRKKVPARDARTLASGRSLELVKYLEKNGVSAEALVAASYPAKVPERGFKIKDQKTIIVITTPASVSPSPEAAVPKQETITAPSTRPAVTPVTKQTATAPAAAPSSQLKSIPISTAVPPKKPQ
jgi:outer membrane protein OmpA-like peptidoglycan-associated protein